MPVASFASVPAMFLHRIHATPDAEAFYYPDKEDNWQTMQWKEVGEKVELIGAGLRSLGIQIEDRCSIVCSTRIEWILVDFGILCAGGATTTIYPSSTAEEAAFIVNDFKYQTRVFITVMPDVGHESNNLKFQVSEFVDTKEQAQTQPGQSRYCPRNAHSSQVAEHPFARVRVVSFATAPVATIRAALHQLVPE